MSVSRIILSVVVITLGVDAAQLLQRNSDEVPLGPYYDTLGDYYDEEPFVASYNVDTDSQDVDFVDNVWEHPNEILGRQLPDSGEFKLNQDKKSQIWCKVKKTIRHHSEPGYEFFPKSYSEYDCLPHTHADGFSENSISISDTCAVKDIKCRPLQKTFVFFKWPANEKSVCALMKVEKTLNVGCNCVNHVKYHYQ